MPKKNNPGCGCCQPPCITDCGDGTTDEIAEWEWSIADLPTEMRLFLLVDDPSSVNDVWVDLKISQYPPSSANLGLAELNGIYVIDHDLVTCQKPLLTDFALVSIEFWLRGYGECPAFSPYDEYFFYTAWYAIAAATELVWSLSFVDAGLFSYPPPTRVFLDNIRSLVNQWSQNMFDVRQVAGGDGPCTSKTYQSTVPWVPGGCTVDASPQTLNNVYTVTPA